MNIIGSIASVNKALQSLTYQGLLNWNGQEWINITVTDQMYLKGAQAGMSSSASLCFDVIPVNDLHVITVPGTQMVEEDGQITFYGLSIYDIDVFDVPNINVTYQCAISVTNGYLQPSTTLSSQVRFVSCPPDATCSSLVMEGPLSDLNTVLQSIVYTPAPDFNTDVHTEFLTITVTDLSKMDYTVTDLVPIVVIATNDPPSVVLPNYQLLSLKGFSMPDLSSLNDSLQSYVVSVSVDNNYSAIRFQENFGVSFLSGMGGVYGRGFSFQGSADSVLVTLNSLMYLRSQSYSGSDTISIDIADSSGNQTSVESSFISLSLYSSSLTGDKDLPEIISISPSNGPQAGGNTVQIQIPFISSNYVEDWFCEFGKSGRSPAVAEDPFHLQCVVPPSAVSAGPVNVRLTDGSTYWSNPMQYYYEEAVHLGNVYPSYGSLEGGIYVLVTGSNFNASDGLTCKFGAEISPMAIFINESAIQCLVPKATVPTAVALQVSKNGLDFSAERLVFTYEEPVVVTALSPNFGPRIGSSRLVVSGGNFLEGRNFTCKIGSMLVPASRIDFNQLECKVPPASFDIPQVAFDLTISLVDGVPKFSVDGQTPRILNLLTTQLYEFSLNTIGNYSFHFSTAPDGIHGGGVEWVEGITRSHGVVSMKLARDCPRVLHVYDANIPGMGSALYLLISDQVEIVDVRISDDGGNSFSKTAASYRFTG